MNSEACKKLVRAGDAHQFLVRTSQSVAHGYVICFNLDGKYVQLAAESSVKGTSDMQKYEKARRLKNSIGRIRAKYQE